MSIFDVFIEFNVLMFYWGKKSSLLFDSSQCFAYASEQLMHWFIKSTLLFLHRIFAGGKKSTNWFAVLYINVQ